MKTSEKIKHLRHLRKMTQTEFAESLGISRSALTQLEAGNTKPSFDVLERLAANYDVDLNVFFDNDSPVVIRSLTGSDEEIARRVSVVKEYYDKMYGIRYNELLVEKLIRKAMQQCATEQDRRMLFDAYKSYAFMSAHVNRVENTLLDPLKRLANRLRRRQDDLDEDGLRPEAWAGEKQALDQIVSETKEYVTDLGEPFMDAYFEIRKTHAVYEDVQSSPLQKLLFCSKETLLNTLEIVLKNADSLQEVEYFYDTDLGL